MRQIRNGEVFIIKISAKSIKAVVFSPTVGTLNSVNMLLNNFENNKEIFDVTLPSAREQIIKCDENDLLVLACPVYAGQVPPVKGLFDNIQGNNTPVVLIAAYGNRHYDHVLAQLEAIAKERGFVVIGAMAPIIPHIFAPSIAMNRPDSKDILVFEDFAKLICERLASNVSVNVNIPGDATVVPNVAKAKERTHDNSLCNNCGLCKSHCPTGAINADFSVIENLCVNCDRCEKICPQKAWKIDFAQITAILESKCSQRREVEIF